MRIDHSWRYPTFSPDGTCIAYLLARHHAEAEGKKPGLYYFDLAANRTVFCEQLPGDVLGWTVFGWTKDDVILLTRNTRARSGYWASYELVALSLADQLQTRHPIHWSEPRQLSPDRKYYFSGSEAAIATVGESRTRPLSGDRELRPWQWDPEGRFLLAWRRDAIKDELERVHKTLTTLWLLRVPDEEAEYPVGQRPEGQLLAVADADPRPGARVPMAALTGDRKRIVYVAENQLRTKELKTLKGAQATAARQRHEQALQAAAEQYAGNIGVALRIYAANSEGALPDPEAGVMEALCDDEGGGTQLFFHPEIPEMMCFEYHPPKHLRMDGIADPATTVLGWLDWGRGWQVYLYADGHCKVLEKKKR